MHMASSGHPRGVAVARFPGRVISPKAITVLGSYKCTAACEHCCFGSNPSLTERLTLQDILQFIEESIKTFPSIETVVFSGGECFLLGEDLTTAVRRASRLGLSVRCVTNGYWAKTQRSGQRRLSALLDAGLSELNVSTGDFHQRWVPEQTVVNAVCMGVELGLRTVLMVELVEGSSVTAESMLEAQPRLRGLIEEREDTGFEIIESPWMPMDAFETIPQKSGRRVDGRNVRSRGGCKSIFTTLVATPSKRIGFCCGLSRERIPELNAEWNRDLGALVEEAASDFMKIWIFVDGPERILAWAGAKNPDIQWEGMYSHHCHACLRVYTDPQVRQTIVEHYHERVDDVLLRYSILLHKQEMLEGVVYG